MQVRKMLLFADVFPSENRFFQTMGEENEQEVNAQTKPVRSRLSPSTVWVCFSSIISMGMYVYLVFCAFFLGGRVAKLKESRRHVAKFVRLP